MSVITIKTRGLQKSFRGQPVLNGLDLDVHHAETVVLIGRSGCGKSVFLKHLLGLITPDAGQIWIDNVSLNDLSAKERYRIRLKFGILFQGSALFDSLSVADNVGFSLIEHTQMTPKEVRMRVDQCLESVDLKGMGKTMPVELSGGMRKRVGLARAVAMKPEILLYDEPTTGLDPLTADSINALMVQLKSILAVTSIVVTHDMVSAYRVGDRIGMLHDGRIHQIGTPEEIQQSKDPIVSRFLLKNNHVHV